MAVKDKKKFILFFLLFIAAGILLSGYRPVFEYFLKRSGKSIFERKGIPADISEIKTGRVIIALTLGQSNAANFGLKAYPVKHNVFYFYHGRIYRYGDPVPGASGTGGSVWGMLGDMLIENNLCDKAVFISIARGSTAIQSWSDGRCGIILKETLNELKRYNIKLTHIFWHQGEEDNLYNTPPLLYKLRLGKVLETIKGYGQDAPMYVSFASFNPWAGNRINKGIRKAQMQFVKENGSVYPGPDTDTLVSPADRFDGIHFSEEGMRKFSQLWLDAVIKNRE